MASSSENSNSFIGPTIPWSSVIPTLRRSISGRVLIVRFGDGASAFCWLVQWWLAPTDYQYTLSLVSPWLFPPSFLFSFLLIDFVKIIFFYFYYFWIFILLIFVIFLFFLLPFFLSFLLFSFLLSLSFLFFFLTLCLSSFPSHSLSLLLNSISSEYAFL